MVGFEEVEDGERLCAGKVGSGENGLQGSVGDERAGDGHVCGVVDSAIW